MYKSGVNRVEVGFQIRIDLSKVLDKVTDAIAETLSNQFNDCDISEYFLEDEDLMVFGNYKTNMKWEYYSQTMESPEEFDEEHEQVDEATIEQAIKDSLVKISDLVSISIEEGEAGRIDYD